MCVCVMSRDGCGDEVYEAGMMKIFMKIQGCIYRVCVIMSGFFFSVCILPACMCMLSLYINFLCIVVCAVCVCVRACAAGRAATV